MLPPLPSSWSSLTWPQLCAMWAVKMRYGGNADVARAAALLALIGSLSPTPSPVREGSGWRIERGGIDPLTGEQQYILHTAHPGSPSLTGEGADERPQLWQTAPRELAHLAKQAIPWFDYPYGDPGEPMERDAKGKVVKERRDGVKGYVSPMQDAMLLPEEEIEVEPMGIMGHIGHIGLIGRLLPRRHFALPQAAMNNLTWQQYRALQNIAQELFALQGGGDNVDEARVLTLQARFVAHMLTPRTLVLFDTAGGSIKFRPHHIFSYDPDRADAAVAWWRNQLNRDAIAGQKTKRSKNAQLSARRLRRFALRRTLSPQLSTLFHICFQVYQTTLSYYSAIYPYLFSSGKNNVHRDALQSEVGTINAVMKYAGYAEQQQVYDANLPFILDILNTMAKEADEIEKMNSKIKKKK